MNPHKQALMEKLSSLGLNETHTGYDPPLPLVTLEDFFEGNNDTNSIAVTLLQHPGVDYFYRALKEIRARPDVQDVLMEILVTRDDGATPPKEPRPCTSQDS
jgi:hypothetical protein